MKREKIIKLQLILISLSIISFEFAIYLWKPAWTTLAIMLGVNGIIATVLIELLTSG